jgi:hypothetical protein
MALFLRNELPPLDPTLAANTLRKTSGIALPRWPVSVSVATGTAVLITTAPGKNFLPATTATATIGAAPVGAHHMVDSEDRLLTCE